jgi:hypothetical protein
MLGTTGHVFRRGFWVSREKYGKKQQDSGCSCTVGEERVK